jgi:hypothetical protein
MSGPSESFNRYSLETSSMPRRPRNSCNVRERLSLTQTRSSRRQTGLQAIINECSVLQASVTSFKHEAAHTLSDSLGSFTKLKQASEQTSPYRNFDTEAYLQGKAVIAANIKALLSPSERSQLKQVESLMLISKPKKSLLKQTSRDFVSTNDLTAKRTSELLAINRRKFGGAYPVSLKLSQEKQSRPRITISQGNLEQSILHDIEEYQRNQKVESFSQSAVKTSHKTRLAPEQLSMKRTPQLILDRTMKYRPLCSNQLKHSLNARLKQTRTSSQLIGAETPKVRVRVNSGHTLCTAAELRSMRRRKTNEN